MKLNQTIMAAVCLLLVSSLIACSSGGEKDQDPLPTPSTPDVPDIPDQPDPPITPPVPPTPPDPSMPPADSFEARKAAFEATPEYQPTYTDAQGTSQTDSHLDLINAAAAYARGATGQGETIVLVGGYIRAPNIYRAISQEQISFGLDALPGNYSGDDHRELKATDKLTFRVNNYLPETPGHEPTPVTTENSQHSTQLASIAAGRRDLTTGLNMHGVAFDAAIHLEFSEPRLMSNVYSPIDFDNLADHPVIEQAVQAFNTRTQVHQNETAESLFGNDTSALLSTIVGYEELELIADRFDTPELKAELAGVRIVQLPLTAPYPISSFPTDILNIRDQRGGFGYFISFGLYFFHANIELADKVIYVWPAGDNGRLTLADGSAAPKDSPGVLAGLGAAFAGLQVNNLAVVALDQDGSIADYSNRCGVAKAFCVAAPGSEVVAASATSETSYIAAEGSTSVAASVVSGALAVLRQHFRGQLDNTEVVARLRTTANKTDIYSDEDIYGQGLIDLDAATRPVGTVMTGLSAASMAPVSLSGLVAPAAYGAAIQQGLGGIEIAGFDSLGHPFWVPAAALVHTQRSYSLLPHRLVQPMAEQAALVPFLRWHDVGAADGLRLTAAFGSFGFSGSMDKHLALKHPLRGLRAGFLVEQNAHQGSRPQGAFGHDVQSNMVFISHERTWPVARQGWVLQSRLLLANSEPDYQEGALFAASRSWYSSAALTFKYMDKDSYTGLSIEQPLRAESGQGTLSYPYGRTADGERLYQSHRFTLEPEARAIQFGLSHDRSLPFGRLALELKYIVNANHAAGEQDTWIGVSFRH